MNKRPWRVSSYTGNQGNCVEIALTTGEIGVRDTKDRRGGQLALPASTWNVFLSELKTTH